MTDSSQQHRQQGRTEKFTSGTTRTAIDLVFWVHHLVKKKKKSVAIHPSPVETYSWGKGEIVAGVVVIIIIATAAEDDDVVVEVDVTRRLLRRSGGSSTWSLR